MLSDGLAFSQNMPTLAACKGLASQYQHMVPEIQDGSKGRGKEKSGNGNEEMDE